MRITHKILLVLIVISLSVIPVLSGCAQKAATTATSSTTVEKPKEIVFHTVHDYSGPLSATTLQAAEASKDLLQYYNDQGGLDGVPLRLQLHDTKYERAAAMAAYAQIREEKPKPLMVFFNTTGDVDALAARFKEDKLVCLAPGGAPATLWPAGWVFTLTPEFAGMTASSIDYISENWSKSGETRKCKIALFNPDYSVGHSIGTTEVEEYIKTKSNIELVANMYFDAKALDLSSDIIRVMQYQPDYLIGFYYATSGAAFYKSLKSSGYIGKVKICSVLWGLLEETGKMAGVELVEGVIGPHFYESFLPKGQPQASKGMQFVSDLFDKGNHPAAYRGVGYLSGILGSYLAFGILKKALAEVGWSKLDSTAVYNTFCNTREMDLGGIGVWGVTEGTRTNSRCEMEIIHNGVAMPLGKYYTCPDMRPAKYRTAEYNWKATGWSK
jgi:ABC-type branched-subunit amino acid transport system substrate-binding protein